MPKERELIRSEFMVRMGEAPSVRDGVLVRRWATGPAKGRPKPSSAVAAMIDRGLLVLHDDGCLWIRAHFTTKGLHALRRLVDGPRFLSRDGYRHLIDEVVSLTTEAGPSEDPYDAFTE